MRAQIINDMNSSLDSYLVNGQMARNTVRVKGIEILLLLLLLSYPPADIFCLHPMSTSKIYFFL